jgi:hypothetical protein
VGISVRFPTTANADPNSVQIRWTGGTCPSNVLLTTRAGAGDTVLVELEPGNPCQEDVGKIRVLEIAFAKPTLADAVTVTVPAASSPSPTTNR